jgi:hypothetical protein
VIKLGNRSLLFGADLFPSSVHLDPEVNMSYDVDLQQAIKEKQEILDDCIRNKYIVVFQHGLFIEACTILRVKGEIEILPVKLDTL